MNKKLESLKKFLQQKLNEQNMKGLVYCIDNRIRVKLERNESGQTIVSLYNGRVHELNKINPQDVNNKQQAELIMKCYDSFAKGNYVVRNKRIEIER